MKPTTYEAQAETNRCWGQNGKSASEFGLFWHRQCIHALTTSQTELFLPPRHHQYTSVLVQIDIGC